MATTEALAAGAPAAAPAAAPDAGASGEAPEVGAGDWDPAHADLDAMQAIMQEPAGDAPAEPAPDAPASAPEAAPAEPVAEPPAEPAPPEPVAAADPAAIKAEQIKLRKGWAALAQDKEALLGKMNDATAAMERAKSFEQKAKDFDAIPEKFNADPLGFVLELAGKKTLEEQEEFVNGLLDKVIEREKSPVEREVMRLRQEIAAKESAMAKAKADSEAKAAQAENDRIIAEWTNRNISFASSTPENVEKYDLIVSLDQGEAVHQTCLAYHKQHNVVLDPATAADYVEKHLRAGVEKSKYIKAKFAVSPPAPPVAPKPPATTAQPSNGTNAPKRPGTTTLSSVASEGSAPSAAGYPEDSDQRFDAVLRDLQSEGILPDEWRVTGPGH